MLSACTAGGIAAGDERSGYHTPCRACLHRVCSESAPWCSLRSFSAAASTAGSTGRRAPRLGDIRVRVLNDFARTRGVFLILELQVVQLAIEPVLVEQLIVRAALRNTALFEHQDLIGAAHRGQALGDHERRAALHQESQRL